MTSDVATRPFDATAERDGRYERERSMSRLTWDQQQFLLMRAQFPEGKDGDKKTLAMLNAQVRARNDAALAKHPWSNPAPEYRPGDLQRWLRVRPRPTDFRRAYDAVLPATRELVRQGLATMAPKALNVFDRGLDGERMSREQVQMADRVLQVVGGLNEREPANVNVRQDNRTVIVLNNTPGTRGYIPGPGEVIEGEVTEVSE